MNLSKIICCSFRIHDRSLMPQSATTSRENTACEQQGMAGAGGAGARAGPEVGQP